MSEPKFYKGQEVRIIGSHVNDSNGHYRFTSIMKTYIGRKATIKEVLERKGVFSYRLEEYSFGWAEEWFENPDKFNLPEELFVI